MEEKTIEKKIEQLERAIPKLKANRKIRPLKIECMEWELRALKAEQKVKNTVYYLAFIERKADCYNNTEFYQLVAAKTRALAYAKVKRKYPDAYSIEIEDTIE